MSTLVETALAEIKESNPEAFAVLNTFYHNNKPKQYTTSVPECTPMGDFIVRGCIDRDITITVEGYQIGKGLLSTAPENVLVKLFSAPNGFLTEIGSNRVKIITQSCKIDMKE